MRKVISAVCLALLFAASCVHHRKDAASLPELYRPAAYIRQLLETAQACDSMSGIIRIKTATNGKTLKAKCLFFVEKPDCFRFEILGFLNQTALLIVSQGDTLSMYMPQENMLYFGAANRKNIGAVLGPPLLNTELVSLLLGVPPVATIEKWKPSCRSSNGLYMCDSIDKNIRHRLWIDPRQNRISGYAFYDNGREKYSITFDHEETTHGCSLPSRADISFADGRTGISVTYDSVSRRAFSHSVFSFIPPAGASIVPFDELDTDVP